MKSVSAIARLVTCKAEIALKAQQKPAEARHGGKYIIICSINAKYIAGNEKKRNRDYSSLRILTSAPYVMRATL